MGRTQEAIAECRRAVEHDPLSLLYNAELAGAYCLARDYNRAIEQTNKTLEIDPKYCRAVVILLRY